MSNNSSTAGPKAPSRWKYARAEAAAGRLCHHRGRRAAGALFDLGDRAREADQLGKDRLRIESVARGIGLVAFDVDAQGGARGAGSGEAVDDAGAAAKQDP